MIGKLSGKSLVYWQTQKPIDYLDTSLVVDTWENVSDDLGAGKPVKIWSVIIEQTNNGAAVENLELEISINGVPHIWSIANAASGTPYYCYITNEQSAGNYGVASSSSARTFNSLGLGNISIPFSQLISLIRVRQTTNVDVVSAQIEVNITFAKLVGV